MNNKTIAIFGICAYILSVIASAQDNEGKLVSPIAVITISDILSFVFIVTATVRLWKGAKYASIILASSAITLFALQVIEEVTLPQYGSATIVALNLTRLINLLALFYAIALLWKMGRVDIRNKVNETINDVSGENIYGYAAELVEYRIQQVWHKPLFGKPFLRFGQCLFLASYFFGLGGILGRRYRDKLDEFGLAFIGAHGEAGAVSRFYGLVAEDILPQMNECLTIYDYVSRRMRDRVCFKGDQLEFLIQYGMQKVKPDSVMHMCRNYALGGSAFGAIYPDHFKQLWEEMHKKQDEESWQFAHAAGLDIPEQQDVMSYDEADQGEVESFLNYCQQYAPSLYVSLSSA